MFSCSEDKVDYVENFKPTKTFVEDFENGAYDEVFVQNGWLNITTVGHENFKIGTYRGKYIQIKGFDSYSPKIESFFISPKLFLSKTAKKKAFKFLVERDYSANETLELLITSKFDSLNPAKSPWEALTYKVPEKAPGWGTFESSGEIDLSNYNGEYRIAFKYNGDNSENGGTFRLDEIQFTQEIDGDDNNNGNEKPPVRVVGADTIFYRKISTKKPSWGTYGIPSQPTWGFVKADIKSSFYSSLNGLKGSALKAEVKKLTQVATSRTSYDRYRYTSTDEDPRNTKNIIQVYLGKSIPKTSTSKWNREHVFACSNGGFKRGSKGGGADNHHIRCADISENSRRGNSVLGAGYLPREAVRGDVARMTFYVALMYDVNPSKNIQMDSAFNWNLNDKVDDWEMKINNVVEDNQGNRNPFIDHPELVEYIFGSKQDVVYTLGK
jgi:endonuclease I